MKGKETLRSVAFPDCAAAQERYVMKKKTGSVEQMLQFLNKEKLQTFQDNFANAYGFSMSFLDLNGNPLTVGSQDSLLCFTIEKEHGLRCRENFKRDMETMKNGESFIHVCPFGIVCLYVPVYFNNRLTAFAAVGGMTYDNSAIPDNLKDRFHIAAYSKEKTQSILRLLESMLRMLNMTVSFSTIASLAQKDEKAPEVLREERISRRQKQVIKLLCKGYSNKEIARRLFINEITVKAHISNVLAKLNLRNRMEIIIYYYNRQEELNEPDESDEAQEENP